MRRIVFALAAACAIVACGGNSPHDQWKSATTDYVNCVAKSDSLRGTGQSDYDACMSALSSAVNQISFPTDATMQNQVGLLKADLSHSSRSTDIIGSDVLGVAEAFGDKP